MRDDVRLDARHAREFRYNLAVDTRLICIPTTNERSLWKAKEEAIAERTILDGEQYGRADTTTHPR
jgi:hypothetical protein